MELLRLYALSFLGKAYRWGGDDPMKGYDCSGFIQEVLASVGEDPPGDQSAQVLYDWFASGRGANLFGPQMGTLLFFGKSVTAVTHVAMALDQYRMIEAGGGGSHVTNAETASEANAFIRIRLIKHRSDLVASIRPYYRKIGLIWDNTKGSSRDGWQ